MGFSAIHCSFKRSPSNLPCCSLQVDDVVRVPVRETQGKVREGVDMVPWSAGEPLSILKSLTQGQSVAHGLVCSVDHEKETAELQWLERTTETVELANGTNASTWRLWQEAVARRGVARRALPRQTVGWDGILDRIPEVLKGELDASGLPIPDGPLFCFPDLPPVKRR
jgi:hypothetical protein